MRSFKSYRVKLLGLFNPKLAGLVASGLVFYCFYLWRLASTPPGLSPKESQAIIDSSNLEFILSNPLYLPHKLVQFAIQTLSSPSIFNMRLVSVLFAALTITCFYLSLSRWFSVRISLLATLAFAATPLLVIVGRSATPLILLSCAFSVVMCTYLWLIASKRSRLAALLTLVSVLGLAIYIPGILLAVVIAGLFFAKRLWAMSRQISKILPYGLVILLGLFASPLIYACLQTPSLMKELFLLPSGAENVSQATVSIVWAGLGIFWRTRDNIPETLGTLPLLSIVGTILLAFGVVYVLSEYRRLRSYALIAIIIAVAAVSGLRADPTIMLIVLPVIYVLVAGGLSFLLQEWLNIFPRNPFAKILAVSLLALVIGVHSIYGFRYAVLAWPQAAETRQVYDQQLP